MQNTRRILVVEDEPDLAELIAYNLMRTGYDASIANDGHAALEKIRTAAPDLVVLDVMLPRLSGLEVAREIRTDPRTTALPIIMLTARAAEADQVAGLGLGADDYITKPFSIKVLLARIEALLRRTPGTARANDPVRFGPVEADLSTYTITVDGVALRTTLTEFRILTALMRAAGRTLSRQDLMAAVMGPGILVTARTIDVHVAAIRRKLGPRGGMILTVRGVGYRTASPQTDDGPQGTPPALPAPAQAQAPGCRQDPA